MRRPSKLVMALSAALVALCAPAAAQVELRPGMVITQSIRVVPKTYRLTAPASLDSAVITVRGDDVTVDFQGATLEGMAPEADPDRAVGVAIRVEGGRNVRIVNARVRGYRVGILVRGTRGLALIDNDVSYTWKPRLFSLIEHESLVDWLSYHHNERDEWLRYGAAIYLADVSGGEIHGNRAVQGMNGLLLARSDHVDIRNNEFSFNSGLGIGLYRSSDDTIIQNRIDYNVRGYSHRFYRRGQDSAGLLMYEQSSRNIVAYNSVTHGGDGLFLWAGQSTMDSGTGGANENLFYANDFSFAPANGMEATFSSNMFVANRAVGSDYGLWGGYGYSSLVFGNEFAGNRTGIAIEHGQDNVITANRFAGDSTAIRLWADSIEPSDWGYPKHDDTRSREYRIVGNVFVHNRVALRARNTSGLVVTDNRWIGVDSVMVLRDTVGFQAARNVASDDTTPPALPPEFARLAPPAPPGGVPGSDLTRRDRSAIVVDEWGPYDWQSPKLWPVDSSRAVPLRLAVLGPAGGGGTWRVVARRGVATISKTAGHVGDTVAVTPAPASLGDWEVTLEYRGAATVSPRGVLGAAGRPYRFSYGRFEPPIDWTVKFFAWTDSAYLFETPIVPADPGAMPRGVPRLDFEWYRPTLSGLPLAHWSLEATGTVTLAPGTYTLRTISDDAVRVWVDGALVIDRWSPHESTVDAAPLTGGRHELRVAYNQVDGWTELRLDIVRGVERSDGSPGPH